MGLLLEVPSWLLAAVWGIVSASGLLIGAVGGYYTSLQHTSIARVMTFAAGVLLAVVAVDLVISARGAASLHWTVIGLLCGAAVFSSVNGRVARSSVRKMPQNVIRVIAAGLRQHGVAPGRKVKVNKA